MAALSYVPDPAIRELTRLPLLTREEEQRADPDRLVLHNTRLVVSIAKRYVDRGLPLADLVQEGLLGLMKAARRFDPARGWRFSTSATWWIRQAVVRALQDRSRLIRIPVRAAAKLDRLPDPACSLEPLIELLRAPAEKDEEPLREHVAWALQALDERERTIVARRHGLDGKDPATLAELGLALGVSRERIRQIERRALEKLRSRLA